MLLKRTADVMADMLWWEAHFQYPYYTYQGAVPCCAWNVTAHFLYLPCYSYPSVITAAVGLINQPERVGLILCCALTSERVQYFPYPCAVVERARAIAAVLLRYFYGNVRPLCWWTFPSVFSIARLKELCLSYCPYTILTRRGVLLQCST